MTNNEANEINSNIISLILSQKDHVTRGEFTDFKNDNNRRFDEVSHRIDEFKHEVNRRFDDVNHRIDEFKHDVDRRFDKIDQRFEKVDQRFEALSKEIRNNSYITISLIITLFGIIPNWSAILHWFTR